MPVVIAGILRAVLLAITTAVPVTVAQEFLDGTMKKLVDEIRSEMGLSLDEAKDVLVNILVDLAVNSTIIGTVIKTRFALKTADFLGFSTKGFSKRVLSTKAAEVVKKANGPWEKFKAFSLISKILTIVIATQATIWLGNVFIQAVEPGIYKPTQTNNVWEKFLGIRPFPETDISTSPPPFSPAEFNDFAASIEAAGVAGINNVFTNQSMAYSRKALSDLIFAAYGNAVLKGEPTTPSKFTATLGQYLIKKDGTTAVASTAGAVTAQPSFISSPRVFTGVVSQGALGAGLVFTPRPDDLIENAEELQAAAQNNLAPFLAALPGRVVYELKIVPTITTKDGFTQRGQAQQIISGYRKDGGAKYRTVINKFAVLHLYILTDRGTRTKIATVVLGPTDALKFQPGQNDLVKVETTIKSIIVTNNIAEISNITPPPAPAKAEPVAAPAYVAPTPEAPKQHPGAQVVATGSGYQVFEGISNSYLTGPVATITEAEKALATIQKPLPVTPPPAPVPAISAPAPVAVTATPKPGTNAATLYEWYTANGQSLPTISARSVLYAQFGLGQAAYYVGTAEQNTKLLAALKAK